MSSKVIDSDQCVISTEQRMNSQKVLSLKSSLLQITKQALAGLAGRN